MNTGSWKTPLITFCIGVLGAGLTYATGFPAPFLTGPAIAVTIAGLAGRPGFGDLHGPRDRRIAQIAGQALHQPALLVDRHPGVGAGRPEARRRTFGALARADIVAQE